METPPPRTDDPAEGREILLLRHAKASRSSPSPDFDRPLTRRGRRDAPRMGRWMKTHDLVPDCVVSSPARRTRETTDLVLGELGLDVKDVRWEERVYLGDVPALLAVLSGLPADARRVLLVGHNPGLEELVRHLAGPTARDPEKGKFLPTCALARLHVEGELREGGAPLVAVVSWSRKNKRWKVREGAAPDG